MAITKFSLSLSEQAMRAVTSRMDGERSSAVDTLIQRYADLLARNQRQLHQLFTPDEKGLIVDALNGTLFADTVSICYAAAEVAEMIDELAEKWQVDKATLRAKLNALDMGQNHALVDGVEQWWRQRDPLSPADLFSPRNKEE